MSAKQFLVTAAAISDDDVSVPVPRLGCSVTPYLETLRNLRVTNVLVVFYFIFNDEACTESALCFQPLHLCVLFPDPILLNSLCPSNSNKP